MFSLSNGLSFLRAPLAFLFLIESTTIRITAILLAMLTDSIDGFVARRYRSATQFGAILDPAMDKFFVFFVLGILMYESHLNVWEAAAMVSRDFFLCVFGIYLSLSGHWNAYEFKSIRWGKITTALQFFVLIGLTIQINFSWYLYCFFVLFGLLAFIELWQIKKHHFPSR
jgi:CDP-diacylglycerol---glycerol-3-phosphate 3-phosphatidyltransferase